MNGRVLRGVEECGWTIRPHRTIIGSSVFTGIIRLSSVPINIDPANPWSMGKPYTSSTGKEFWLEVAGGGGLHNTGILDTQSAEPVENVSAMKWEYDSQQCSMILTFEIDDIIVEISPPLSRVQPAVTSITGSAGPPSSYAAGPGNPFFQPPQHNPYQYPGTTTTASAGATTIISGDASQDSQSDQKDCDHEWTNVSFAGLKMACKHCGINMPPP